MKPGAAGADAIGVRLIIVVVLLAMAGALGVRQAMGHAHRLAISLALVPGLVLGFFEYENHRADLLMTHAASVLAGRPVHVTCQRLGGTFVDAGAELGYVRYEAGHPGDETVLKYDACQALYDWMGSDKANPTEMQVIAVHVLAHESEHLAGFVDEAVAECRSVQTTEQAAELLGASPAQARALAVRYATDVYPRMPDDYRSDQCRDGGLLDLHPGVAGWP